MCFFVIIELSMSSLLELTVSLNAQWAICFDFVVSTKVLPSSQSQSMVVVACPAIISSNQFRKKSIKFL